MSVINNPSSKFRILPALNTVPSTLQLGRGYCLAALIYLFKTLLFTTIPVAALAQQADRSELLIIPNSVASKPAEGGQISFQGNDTRSLNLYDSTEFSSIPDGAMITGLSFRLDEAVQGSKSVDIPAIEIRMSTSSATVSQPPPTYSESVGADETIVYPRGPLHIDALASTSPLVPAPFTGIVKLSTSFFYLPSKGSLAVDFHTAQGADIGLLLDAGGKSIALAGPASSDIPLFFLPGLILQLQVQPVPEPSIVQLILVGFTVFASYRTYHICHPSCT